MHYVYILRSLKDDKKSYVGQTNNLKRRLNQHNSNPSCAYTKSYMPWEMVFHAAFVDRSRALEFEVYLKSNSGKAFLKKHLI